MDLVHIMKNKKVFVSLGPACITADILQSIGLRRFSLPFDWARSGSLQLEELLFLSPEQFYERNIVSPNLKLVQTSIPSVHNNYTIGLSHAKSLYGFPYFYNPHRSLREIDKNYYIRCLERFASLFLIPDLHIHFLAADIMTRPGETYFQAPVNDALHYIADCLKKKFDLVENQTLSYDLKICRIKETSAYLSSLAESYKYHNSAVVEVEVPQQLIDWKPLVGKSLYAGENIKNTLIDDPLS